MDEARRTWLNSHLARRTSTAAINVEARPMKETGAAYLYIGADNEPVEVDVTTLVLDKFFRSSLTCNACVV